MKDMLDKVTKTEFRFGDLREGRNQDVVIETEPSPDDPSPAQKIIQAAAEQTEPTIRENHSDSNSWKQHRVELPGTLEQAYEGSLHAHEVRAPNPIPTIVEELEQEAEHHIESSLPTPLTEPQSLGPLPGNEDDTELTLCVRGTNSVLIVSTVRQECYLLKWKTFNKLARKGKELDPKYFNEHERVKLNSTDAKEWQSFIDSASHSSSRSEESSD